MGASAAFTSPFGYQTNLMVYGAGGYKVGDFVRFGLPLQFIAAVVAIFVSAFFDWWWLISILLAAAAALSLGAGTMSSFAGRILKKDPSELAITSQER